MHSFDWTVGQILDALDRLRMADNTLVIVTSDNGGTLDNNGPDVEHGIGSPEANAGHLYNGLLRAGKGSKGKPAFAARAELYDLAQDIGETQNVASQHPEIVDKMQTLLSEIQARGRSRP